MREETTAETEHRAVARPIDRAWAALPALLPALVSLLSSLGTVDLAYHLRLGQIMLDDGTFVRVDTLTFSAAGTEWVNQQWGAQILLALLHGAGGWATLGVAQALLIGFSFWLVSRAAILRGATPRFAGLLAVAGFLVAAPNLSLRPQLLALPLVTICVWVLADRRRRPGRLWLVPVVALLLANIHGSFVLVPLLVGLAWLEDRIERAPDSTRLFAVGAASLAATLVNPFGIGAWIYVYDLSTNEVVRDTIAEWAPVSLASLSGWLMLGSATALAVASARWSERVAWGAIVSLVVFFAMAMASQRATLWWAVVAPVVAAPLLWGEKATDDGGGGTRVTRSRGPAHALILCLAAVVALALPWWRATSYEANLRGAPGGITDAVRRTLPEGSRVFMNQPWASWFEFAVPEVDVFVDSRIELFPEEVWLDYGHVAFAGARWQEVLERWQPDAVVAEADWDLLPSLRRDPSWRVVFEDGDGVLFVRA